MSKRSRVNVTLKVRNIPEESLQAILELIRDEPGAKVGISDEFHTNENSKP